jgi:hypothetical protein
LRVSNTFSHHLTESFLGSEKSIGAAVLSGEIKKKKKAGTIRETTTFFERWTAEQEREQ